MSVISRLHKLAEKWGGSLVKVPKCILTKMSLDQSKIGYSPCPFSNLAGVFWDEKCVMYSEGASPNLLIHEMGHVFAATDSPTEMKLDGEYEFLGWEYVLARKVRAPIKKWMDDNSDYELTKPISGYVQVNLPRSLGGPGERWHEKGDIIQFGRLPDVEKKMVIQERLEHALDVGLIVNGEPIALR